MFYSVQCVQKASPWLCVTKMSLTDDDEDIQ